MKLLILSAACLAAALAVPPKVNQVSPRNTIFLDEKFEGEVFDDLDVFSEDVSLLNDAELYRLPTTTKPLHYTVLWSTDFANVNALAFGGTVTIQLVATQANVNDIVIHSNELTITSYSLSLNGSAIPVTLLPIPEYHFLRFQLQNGQLQYSVNEDIIYSLTISFEALMREDMYGIYKSWFRTGNETHWMASTQFQATAARSAFPCYDEPSFKAYFDVTIRRPERYTSWFCTTLDQSNPSTSIPGAFEDVYHTTPYMSTYLLALIVAEYSSIPHTENNVVTYEVIARPDAIADGQGQYAFEVGQLLLAEMSDHTGIDFYSVDPNIKMTQAAIPDFGAGAMENWGLLTYREAYLMYSEAHTNNYFKQLIAYILSHEIAHMWFGNLVTCEWWDMLWLNEGFARYYQYFLTHWIEDYMGFETRFITEQVHTALLSDAANNPHPLTNPGVGSPAAVSAMFSTLSYNKGAAVIRMTEHLLGFEVHREGLRNYLQQFQFGVAQPINLFEALETAAIANNAIEQYGPGFSFIDYYKSFTEQAGAPVLNVEVNHQTGDMIISQRRFNINTGFSSVSSNWVVPITFATASNPDFQNTKPSHVISEAVTVINRGSVGDEWVIFNKQQTGYYRVNYDEYTWDLIIMALRNPTTRAQIHEYNRAQIVNDVFQFARSGLMTYNRAFNILSFLENETSYAPWVAAITGFNWIRNRLAGTPTLAGLETTIVSWAQTVMADIGYVPSSQNEDFMREYLRYQLGSFMCNMEVQACVTAATTQFAALRAGTSEVDVNNRNFVYCTALRHGTAADFQFLWQRFETHPVYTEKILLLQTLGCTRDRNSLFDFLDGIVQENELVRPQDYTTAWSTAVSGNEENTQIVLDYVKENLNAVRTAFSSITTPVSYISARLRSQEAIDEFESWVRENATLIGDESTVQTLINGAENSRVSIQWAASVSGDINAYIAAGSQPVELSTTEATVSTEAALVDQPPLSSPIVPDLPETSSATTTFVSTFLILSVVAARFMA